MMRFRSKIKAGISEDGIVSESVGQWLAIGLCFGVSLGAILDNVGLGISLGMCIGVAIGSAVGEKKKQKIFDSKPRKTRLFRDN